MSVHRKKKDTTLDPLGSTVNEIIRWLMATLDTGGEVEERLDLIH